MDTRAAIGLFVIAGAGAVLYLRSLSREIDLRHWLLVVAIQPEKDRLHDMPQVDEKR